MLIRLAGLVAIEHDGSAPRHLLSAQAQVAFARMTLERASGTSRDQLADTVWPDELPDTWASALRSVVSRVRAFVAGTQAASEATLVAQGGRYLLRLPADAVVDLERAEAEVSEATEAFAAGACADAQRLTTAAVSCLERPFLPNHEGEWVTNVRERMSELLVSGLTTASLAASALHDERNAVRFAEEAVRRAPLRESTHRCLMSAHLAAGNRAEALRTYHALRRMLAEELGIDPAPETQAAYVDILGAPVTSSSRTHGPVRSAAPFVGRRTELATLAEAWSQAEHGASHLVLVTGESGIGKTRLVTEAARRITLAGGVVMYGRCDHGSTVPYQPFMEALGGFLAATPGDSLPQLSHATRESLAMLIAQPQHPIGEVTPSKRAELLLTLTDLLVRVAHDQSVFLVLDDIDLADHDTLVLLRNLFRRRSGTSLLVVATAGVPARRPDHVAAAIHDIDREGWLHRVAVRGLDETDVRTLVRQMLPETSADHVPSPHRLVADTAGNPYLVVELLRWHRDTHSGARRRGVPSGINDYAAARLAALEPAPRQLLRTAAAAGPSFELDVTAEAAELDTVRSMDALEALVAHGIVAEVVNPANGHEYRYIHEILRRALYEQLSQARRRWLHTRLADAIERRRAGNLSRYSRILAHHRAVGAEPDGDQRAVRWAWRAAARALGDGAPEEAVCLHRQALDHVPAADHQLRAEALTNLGLAQLAAGHPECDQTILNGAIQALHSGRLNIAAQAALGLADTVNRRPQLRRETTALIDLLVRKSHPDQQIGRAEPSSIDGVTLGLLLAVQCRLGIPVAAGTTATTALAALARELCQLEGPAHVTRRLTLAEEMLIVATATNDRNAQMLAAHHRAMAAEMTGDLTARQEALAALMSAVGDGELLGDALLVDHAVATAVTQGRFTDAVAASKLATPVIGDAARGITPTPGSLAARQLLIARWLRRSTWPTIAQFSRTAETAERSLTALIEGDRGWSHLAVRALATGAEPLPSGDEWAHSVGLLALGCVELGDPTTADAVRTLLLPYANLTCGVGYRSFVGPASFHLGRLAVLTGDWDEAERQLSSALPALASRQARPWLALAEQALARARAGDRRPVHTLRAEANRALATSAHAAS